MCNEAARRIALGLIRDDFSQVRIELTFPEGLPNLEPVDSVRITDPTAIVRYHEGAYQLVQRRWSWPGPTGKPVYNYRSEGRMLLNAATSGRCLIPLDGFYEFTAAEAGAKRKTKWLFTPKGRPLLCVAGLWRVDTRVGEAFTMLTCAPGPDVAPYHARQVALLPPEHWAAWLTGAEGLLGPAPQGTLEVTRVS